MLFANENATPLGPEDVRHGLYQQLDEDVAAGKYRPYVLPFDWLGAAATIIYLLIPHHNRPMLRRARFLVFAFNALFSVNQLLYTRSRAMSCQFGLGVLSAWSIVWTSVWLLFNDAHLDFERIKRLDFRSKNPGSSGENEDSDLGDADMKSNGYYTEINGSQDLIDKKKEMSQSSGHRMYKWQPYPLFSRKERLDWVIDLFSNFRGPGWNWQLQIIPVPPQHVRAQVQDKLKRDDNLYERQAKQDSVPFRNYVDKKRLLRRKLITFVLGYLMLDLLKVVMMKDPFFYGFVDEPAEPHLPTFARIPIFPHRTYRLLLSLIYVYTFLQTIFAMAPLFFVGVLGEERIGTNGEAWMYPDSFGSFSAIYTKGLAGWWGDWWHQIFRYAFETIGRALRSALHLEKHSLAGKFLKLLLAFTLSGAIHACGSHALLGGTNPLSGSFTFFVLQAFGIVGEIVACHVLNVIGVTKVLPLWLRQTGTFAFVHLWLLFTGHLICNDFARGAVWLLEPVPVSPLRALGYGLEGEGWWCWSGEWVRWHTGRHWWQSGLWF